MSTSPEKESVRGEDETVLTLNIEKEDELSKSEGDPTIIAESEEKQRTTIISPIPSLKRSSSSSSSKHEETLSKKKVIIEPIKIKIKDEEDDNSLRQKEMKSISTPKIRKDTPETQFVTPSTTTTLRSDIPTPSTQASTPFETPTPTPTIPYYSLAQNTLYSMFYLPPPPVTLFSSPTPEQPLSSTQSRKKRKVMPDLTNYYTGDESCVKSTHEELDLRRLTSRQDLALDADSLLLLGPRSSGTAITEEERRDKDEEEE